MGLRTAASRIMQPLRHGRFGHSVALLAGGTALGHVLIVASSPLLARMYTPSEFGAFGVYSAFVVGVTPLLSLTYETAIVGASSDGDGDGLVELSGRLVVPSAAIATLLMAILVAKSALGLDALPAISVVAAFATMLIMGFYNIARQALLREERFETLSQAAVLFNGGRPISQLLLGPASIGWWGLAIGDLVGRALGLLRLRRGIPRVREQTGNSHAGRHWPLAKAYREFPLFLAPSTLLNSASLLLPVPLVSMLYGVEAAGWFYVVQRLLSLPMSLVGMSVADVFHARIGQLHNETKPTLRLFFKTAGVLGAIGLVPFIILITAGSQIFAVVLGNDWTTAGQIAARLAPLLLVRLVVSPLTRIVLVMGGQVHRLVFDIALVTITIGSLVGSHALGLHVVSASLAYSIAASVAYVAFFFLLANIVRTRQGRTKFPSTGPEQANG